MFNFKRKNKKEDSVSVDQVIFDLVNEKENQEDQLDKTTQRLVSILKRKDLIDIDNDKVDALRMFLHYIKNDELDATKLVKYLRS